MLDIGWSELMVIGVVALIVIGPKELPEMFRTLGRFTAKARSMARDFQRAMDSAANEAGVQDIAKDLKAVTSPASLGLDAVKKAATKFEQWDPLKPAPKPAPATAVKPAEPTAAKSELGPATKALAEEIAAKRATLAAGPVAEPDPEAPAPPPKAQRKAVTRKPAPVATTADAAPAAAKPSAKKAAKAEAGTDAPKPSRATAKAGSKRSGVDLLGAAVDKSSADKARKSAKAGKPATDSGNDA